MWPNWTFELIVLITTFWISVYLYVTRNFNYWKERNVPYLKPIPFFGNAIEIFTLRKSIGDLCKDIYQKTTKPFIGFFVCDTPCLMIRDLDLIKTILIKDFGVFSNRNVAENKKDDAMGSYMLFILRNPEWKDVRRKLTPIFTSGKMKLMYELIRECGENMVKYLEKEVPKNPIIDSREVAAKYTTDAITSTAFGINANCFRDENAEFRVVSRRVFNWKILERAIATTCYFISHRLVKLFRLKFIDTRSANFLREAFWKVMNEREQTKFVRNDLIDILIEMKNNEEVEPDPYKLEGDKLVSQATQFFLAGFETTSSTISFTLYELALNPHIQEKLREEILSTKKEFGKFSYEALKKMEYLDRCIKETLRKYPSLPFLDRVCSIDYKLPGTDLELKKGTGVFISNWGLHFDPEYFPNPDEYDPTRFTEENIKSRPQFAYLPFGEGPRNCIGARFGTLSSKSGVAHIISKYKIELAQETNNPLILDPKGFLLAPYKTLNLKFKEL